MQTSSNELIKHSATIHVSNSLSLLERKIYNILLKNAFHDLMRKDSYKISFIELKRNLGREGNTDNEIKEAIEKLVGTRLKWNIFDKDSQNEWGVTTVLAAASMERGICSYEYSSKLKLFLAKPNVYARLNLLVQREFRSKHALALWEFLVDKLCTSKKDEIDTEWIDVDSYRMLLNIGGQYNDFKALNRDTIKKPVDEINKVSDIEVEVNYKKSKKRVNSVSFSIKRKSNFQFSLPIDAVEENDPFQENSTLKIEDTATMLKNAFKLSTKAIESIMREYDIEEIISSIDYVKVQLTRFPIENIAAYTKAAIKNGWKIESNFKNVKDSDEFYDNDDCLEYPAWKHVRQLIKVELGEDIFNSWIRDIKFSSCDDGGIVNLIANSKLKKERLESRYLNKILKIWKGYDSEIRSIKLSQL
jgi:plasmid replication initiation protein